ncbi:unnamed protein product [Oppiella nova]|uniref:Uncharacterized protein n=1 Tax=Oppiella nova TaxID=334625 RepID=A0A7R9M7T0_9ACAR|nr:unnamed protein product [Oppiella nova]CAG2172391.1 unnamed protein product [Oppiella nova]
MKLIAVKNSPKNQISIDTNVFICNDRDCSKAEFSLNESLAPLIVGEPCEVVIVGEVIEGPNTTQEFDCWLKAMHEFRQSERIRINYTDANYKLAELQWAQSNVLQPQMMAHDRDFYDYTTHEYTVDKYANRLKQRYGGIDSVLIWPNYPNIGIDNRNMDDMTRDMPHGIDGLKKMVAEFHQHNIKVLFPLQPWDNGTRDPGADWSVIVPKTMAEIGADGLNGDTMLSVNKEYFDNSVRDLRPLVLEPEWGLIDEGIVALSWNVMSWGYKDYWDVTSARPVVSRNKWIETRHQGKLKILV